MSQARAVRFLRLAAVLALAGLALMVWSMLDPRPAPVLVAMSIGQGIGISSLLLYVVVVVADARRAARQVERTEDQEEPPA